MPNNKTSDVMVQIKGDQKDLDKALRSSKSSLKNFSSSAISTGAALAKMAAIGAVAIAGLTYASWNLTKGFKDYGVQLDKISKSTGVNAEATSQMAYAAEQEHASLEDLQTGWRKLSKTMGDADEGLAESLRSFDALGLSIYDNTGQLKNLDSMTLEIADAFKDMTNDTQKAALAQDLFGRSGMNLIPFFELGSEGINSLMRESVELGNVWSDDMAAGAKVFDDKLTALNYSFTAVKWQIGNALLPEFEKITDWFLDNKTWLITTFAEIFDIDMKSIGDDVITNLDRIKTWIDDNKTGLGGLWDDFRTATDMSITSVKVLFTSMAELAAFSAFLKSGGGQAEWENLQRTSASTAEMYQDIGQKPWAQDIVSAFQPSEAPQRYPTPELANGYSQFRLFTPGSGLERISQATSKLITLKLDANATRDLLSGTEITASAVVTGT